MLISASISEKYMGNKLLLKEAYLLVQENQKVALIGRNGAGKSTLFHLLSGDDTEFTGSIDRKKGIRVIATAQEHHAFSETTAVNYILDHVPEYFSLQHVLETYPESMGEDLEKIHTYTEALQVFTERNYFNIEEEIVQMLAHFDIDIDAAYRPLGSLSGGQKRFVELVKISFAQADLLLLDEPTNHLDYHGKAQFLTWLKSLDTAALIISHDRDVLRDVSMIIELKDQFLHSYPGNYDAYIKQNGTATVTQISQYESSLKRLETLKKQMLTAKARMGGASDSRPKILYERLKREFELLQASLEKPSFWIDKDTVDSLSDTVTKSYDRYKARGIKIKVHKPDTHTFQLLSAEQISIGYTAPLASGLSFSLQHGERLNVRGRNGAGKSTLIKTILATANKEEAHTLLSGNIATSPKLRIGVYKQEIDQALLDKQLGQAVLDVYNQIGQPISSEQMRAILSTYLFDPLNDADLHVRQLSGGQKARLQLIKMLCNNPNLLILDEPTNHLDLPSIEELEQALGTYAGAILYVSHDSYFIENIGGLILQIGKD